MRRASLPPFSIPAGVARRSAAYHRPHGRPRGAEALAAGGRAPSRSGPSSGRSAGWNMPIEYEGALAEHRAVRERVGLFDLTHLGKVEVDGPGALALLQGVVTNDVAAIEVGRGAVQPRAQRGRGRDRGLDRLPDARPAILRGAERLQHPPRAADPRGGRDAGHGPPDVPPGLVLPGGPGADVAAHRRRRCSRRPTGSSFMRCTESSFQRRPVIVTRSGYTGEVGFELFTYQDIAVDLWRVLLEAVRDARRRSVRAGRTRCAAARDGLPAVRSGSLRVLDRVRGGPVLGGFDGQGPVPRARGARPATGRGPAEPSPRPADARAPAYPAGPVPGVRRRSGDRRGDERHVLAVAADRDRAGVPLAGRCRGRRATRWRSTSGAAAVRRPSFARRSSIGARARRCGGPARSRGPCRPRNARCEACVASVRPAPGVFGVRHDDHVEPRAGDARLPRRPVAGGRHEVGPAGHRCTASHTSRRRWR